MQRPGSTRGRPVPERPVRVGLIGAGKFGTMFLEQSVGSPYLQVVGIADLRPEAVREGCRRRRGAAVEFADSPESAVRTGGLWIGDDPAPLLCSDWVDVIVEATGSPTAGIDHARRALRAGCHVVMVNLEADALAGPMLAAEARRLGRVYSLAYGDQPALIVELVDWARECNFPVVAAGKGTRYLPSYHAVTTANVWENYGISEAEALSAGMNPRMFTSFLDGTKSAIEMAAVANCTGLSAPEAGLSFPPCPIEALPELLKPKSVGGMLEAEGRVEVVSCLNRDGSPVVNDLRWGVFVVVRAPNDYVRSCFREYGMITDRSGEYAVLYRSHHFIGLELGVSILAAALDCRATGCPESFRAEVVAAAKRPLPAGTVLDGEGGETVYGRLMPAERARAEGAVPIGLAHGVTLLRDLPEGAVATRRHVGMLPAVEAPGFHQAWVSPPSTPA